MADSVSPERKKLGLSFVLTVLVLATVVLTALFIHLLWANAARRNVADVVQQLNTEIIDRVGGQVRGVLDDAVAAQNAVGSVFASGTIGPEDEAKRDFVFLALLRSKPSLSWISFAAPDGSFFGAQRDLTSTDGEHFNLVTVRREGAMSANSERVFRFRPRGNDIEFVGDQPARASSYDAREQPWYRRAMREQGPGWSDVGRFPNVVRAGISTSTTLDINSKFAGVINVAIDLERLSGFLRDLEDRDKGQDQIVRNGTIVVIDRTGQVIASGDSNAIAQQRQGLSPMLHELGAANSLLAVVDRTIESMQIDLTRVDRAQQVEIINAADGESYYVTFAALKTFPGWLVATVVPANDFLASIEENAEILAGILIALTLAMAGLAALLANRLVARPLARIVGQLKHIEGFRLDRVVRIPSRLREFDGLSTALLQMSRGLASFQKYMPIELVRTLVSKGIEAKPGGEQQMLTVMFADLAGFTSLSEILGEGVVPVLTEYLETATSAVVAHHGTIDKFIGDAVMAFWGAPNENRQHARDACAAALALQAMMMARQPQLPPGDARAGLRVRIGINTGRMLVGNIGSADRLNYTVIGDPVNVASRLEGLNKFYGTSIVVGEETRLAAGDAVVSRRLDWVAVFGRTEGIAIYELLAMAEAAPRLMPAWVTDYETGLDLYRNRRWAEAGERFAAADAMRPGGDPPAQLFSARCRALLQEPPGWDWTPVAVQTEK